MRLASLLLFAMMTSALALETIPLWPQGAPGEKGGFGAETNLSKPGESVMHLSNISNPTIAVYQPSAGNTTGAGVVVCPGGGYHILAYDLEGTEICRWLNSLGITGVLLKYRVPAAPQRPRYEAPLQDAQRALSLARAHAADWRLNTNRIGILGFSAGGHLSALTSCRFNQRSYARVDEADDVSCRPDFTVLIYPAYLTATDHSYEIAPELTINSDMPPVFLVQTEDDSYEDSLAYCLALKKARVPAELHFYAKGGHGYGLRPSPNPVSNWPRLAEQWFRSIGLLAQP